MHIVLPKWSSGEWRLRQNDSLNERTPGTLDPGRGTLKSGGLSMTTLLLRGDLAILSARGS